MFDRLRSYLPGVSWPIIAAMLALMVISVLAVRIAEAADPSLRGCTARQIAYVAVAIVAFAAAAVVPYQRIGRGAYVWFALNLGLLVLVLFLPPIRHSHRWINLRLFQVQPSELAKLTYIVALAWYLRYRENYRRIVGLLPPFLLTLVPAGLILIEPDLGTALLLFPTLLFMLFMAGAKLRHLLAVVAVAAGVVFMPIPEDVTGKDSPTVAGRKALAYWRGTVGGREYILAAATLKAMEPHQLSRIEGWLRQSDPAVAMTKGFQLQQSIIILGSGGLRGQGVLRERNLHFRMLPDDHTDFIYAVVGGQWGFLGCAGLMIVYAAIFICAVEIASMTDDPFARLLVVGVMALLGSQIFINVGMTMGLMPITGMTLPLVSFGGSSMVVNAAALGLLVNVGIRRPILLGRKPFEFGRGKADEDGLYDTPLGDLEGQRRRRWLRGGSGRADK